MARTEDVVGRDRAHEPGQGAAREVGERLQVGSRDLPGPELLDDDQGHRGSGPRARRSRRCRRGARSGASTHRSGHEQRRAKGGREREGDSPGKRRLGRLSVSASLTPRELIANRAGRTRPVRTRMRSLVNARGAASSDDVPAGRAGLEPRAVRPAAQPHGWRSGSSFPSRRCRSRRPITTPVALRCRLPSPSSAAGPTCSRCASRPSSPVRSPGAPASPEPRGGVAFVLGLNTVRIATLGHAAASPALFRALHLQVWPAILVLATAGYVFAWMRRALGATGRTRGR